MVRPSTRPDGNRSEHAEQDGDQVRRLAFPRLGDTLYVEHMQSGSFRVRQPPHDALRQVLLRIPRLAQ